jgi:hypothetical protein
MTSSNSSAPSDDDRTLLERAAKAAGINAVREFTFLHGGSSGESKCGLWNRDAGGIWNSLTNSGNALDLAVKLQLAIAFYNDRDGEPMVHVSGDRWKSSHESCANDASAAVRRCITRAAAAIGETA